LIAKIKHYVNYVKDSWGELKKVTWPDKDEVTSFTVVVVIALIIFSTFLWLVDTGIMGLIQVVMN
jgi:preprotein translocase subunit SecE